MYTDMNTVYKISSVQRIVDGDTIDVLINLGFDVTISKRIRLSGIDTPECRTTDLIEKKFGILAKQRLSEWFKKETVNQLQLRCKTENDKYGRVLAEIWVEDNGKWINVNQWMVDNYYAAMYDGQNKNDIQDQHLSNREKLKKV